MVVISKNRNRILYLINPDWQWWSMVERGWCQSKLNQSWRGDNRQRQSCITTCSGDFLQLAVRKQPTWVSRTTHKKDQKGLTFFKWVGSPSNWVLQDAKVLLLSYVSCLFLDWNSQSNPTFLHLVLVSMSNAMGFWLACLLPTVSAVSLGLAAESALRNNEVWLAE